MDRNATARLGLAALALAALPSAVAAQPVSSATLTNASLAKSEAILGGAPSRLTAILAEQKGLPLPVPARVEPLRPAAGSPVMALPAIAYEAPKVREAIVRGQPDLFGSVALAISRTPLDHRWRKVERARLTGEHARYAASLRHLDAVDRIEAVNRYVNRRVEFVDDSVQFGRADVWVTAAQTLRRGRGDCEDYAIAKMQLLRAAGFDDRDLYLVIVKDLVRRADHAVLVVRAGGRALVLDNGTDRVLDSAAVSDYRPMLTLAADGAWTHGYRRPLPPITIASADIGPLSPSAAP
ncbi:MAG TPA: transglutaminase-like cysteine peptidase [Sphingomicrobium sp.]|nr:transglutaminase-like cysteine peptidase [Sphingomicrobium sp.]